jgi:hypothetical protein
MGRSSHARRKPRPCTPRSTRSSWSSRSGTVRVRRAGSRGGGRRFPKHQEAKLNAGNFPYEYFRRKADEMKDRVKRYRSVQGLFEFGAQGREEAGVGLQGRGDGRGFLRAWEETLSDCTSSTRLCVLSLVLQGPPSSLSGADDERKLSWSASWHCPRMNLLRASDGCTP